MRLEGKKVILREKRRTDAVNDYAWSIDEELCRLDAAQPTSLSFGDAMMLYEEELLYPPPRRKRFAIDTHDGYHIGNCMLYDINESRKQTELGIMIGDRRYWGKSFGTDAIKTLLVYAFNRSKMKRVYLHTLEWNDRAQRSFAKAGFIPTGKVRRNGHTFIAMEITQEQWERRRKEEQTQTAKA